LFLVLKEQNGMHHVLFVVEGRKPLERNYLAEDEKKGEKRTLDVVRNWTVRQKPMEKVGSGVGNVE